jgi:aromatic-amino-acid transaminase
MQEHLISEHRSRPSDDPIFALHAEAKARGANGESIVNATVGVLLDDSGALATLPSVIEALQSLHPAVAAGYAPIEGMPDFVRAVADDLLGPWSSSAAAVATPGGSGALHHAISSFVEPGQAVLTSSFYWSPYKTLAEQQGRTLRTFRMFDGKGRFDVSSFELSLNEILSEQGRALVVLNSPCHNPTGYSLDEGEWEQVAGVVASAARRGPLTVLIDGAYALYAARDLARDRERILKMGEHALLLFAWSASKSYLLYGSRVGALVAFRADERERRRIANALSFACRGTWGTCSSAGMAAITRALTEPDLVARASGERATLKALLDRRVAAWNERALPAGLSYPRYDGGFFTTVLCDGAFEAAAALKQDGVYVVPQAGGLRVALCAVPERDVPRIVDAVSRRLRIA